MKFGIIVFPGSNCDDDMVYVIEHVLNQKAIKIWHKSYSLESCDAVILPGGFSYGDYLRSGAIARFSPIMKEVYDFANKGGFVFGICNGFQILTESGLLPGALLHNHSRKYICKNVYLRTENHSTAVSSSIPEGKVLKIPIAHGEGCYYTDGETLKRLEDNNQVLFRYCDENGNVTSEANPNGALSNIAGICNQSYNVFGMMPHPERAALPFLGNEDGVFILHSVAAHLQAVI